MKLRIIRDEAKVLQDAAAARLKVEAAFREAAKQGPDWLVNAQGFIMWPSGEQIGRLLADKARTAAEVRQMQHPRAAWRDDRILVINLPRIRRALNRMFRLAVAS